MLTPHDFHEIVSGRRRGVAASAWRLLFAAAEPIYRIAAGWKNRKYDRPESVTWVERPVISVGNLTVGGTGKTPVVEAIARYFRQQNIRVSLVSRGYKAADGGMNDEALELEQKLPDVPHVQNPDRIAAARIAIDELDTQLIVLDDAFQHRRIGRDLDIVLIDATEPFGYDRLLPRGLLREPVASLSRADVIGLTRADMVDETRRLQIKQQVEKYNNKAVWVEMAHRPQAFMSASGETVSLNDASIRNVLAFSGIGNPQGFLHSAKECGCKIVDRREFPDHHRYTRDDLQQLADWAGDHSEASALLCTHKDLVKIGVDRVGSLPLYALVVGVEFSTGEDLFNECLQNVWERYQPESPARV